MAIARRSSRLVLLIALLALALAGCGGGDESAEGGGGAPAEEPAGDPVASVDVVETDFEIGPTNATVDQTGVIEFNISNEGQTVHSLEIEAPDQEFVSDTMEPGQSTTFTAELPAGEHVWYCPIANHRELGMEGSITVGGSGGGSGGDDNPSSDDAGGEDSTSSEGSGGSFPY